MNELKRACRELRKILIHDANKVEFWIAMDEHPGYFISSFGKVLRRKPRMDGKPFYPKIGKDTKGYSRVTLNGKSYLLHILLAQAFISNPEGKPCVDHIDGNPRNNCLSNLRWATYAENQYNRRKPCNNTSDYTGVTFNKEKGKWKAYIRVDRKYKFLGYFHTKEEAAAVREKAARELHGEFFSSR